MTDKAELFTVKLSETIHREVVVPARSAQEALDTAFLLRETAGWASFKTQSVDPNVSWSTSITPEAEIYRPMNLVANLYLLYDRLTNIGVERAALAPLRKTVEMQISELSTDGHGRSLLDSRHRYETQRATNALPSQIIEASRLPTQPANTALRIVPKEPAKTISFFDRLKHLPPRAETNGTVREQDNLARQERDPSDP